MAVPYRVREYEERMIIPQSGMQFTYKAYTLTILIELGLFHKAVKVVLAHLGIYMLIPFKCTLNLHEVVRQGNISLLMFYEDQAGISYSYILLNGVQNTSGLF